MSAAMDSRTDTIYIELLDEGTTVCRPTTGVALGGDVYRVQATPNYDPDDEQWEFVPGTIVKCEREVRSGGSILVAKRIVEQP